MNLQDFTLLKEDQTSYTVGHPHGKSIRVAKRGLSSKAQDVVSKLKRTEHFDEGGQAQQPPQKDKKDYQALGESVSKTNAQKVKEGFNKSLGFSDGGEAPQEFVPPEQMLAAEQGSTTPIGQEPTVTSAQAEGVGAIPEPVPSPQSPQTGMVADVVPGLTAEKEAIAKGAQAEADMGKQEADAQHQGLAQMSRIPTPQATFAANQKKSQDLQDDIARHNIDPDRYWHNMSTGSKITSLIGMLISGVGAGLSGQPNMVTERIKDAVAQDIEAQKADQNKKMSLWNMNREHSKDEMQANIDTENQYMSIVKMKMMQAASGAMGPMAAARVAPAIGAIDQAIAQGDWKKTMLQQQSYGGISHMDPAQIVPMMTSNPEIQKEALAEVGKKQYMNQNYQQMMDLYEKAEKENTLVGRAGRLGHEPPSMAALRAMADPILKDKDGRPSEILSGHFNDMLPGAGERPDTAKQKKQQFADWLKQGPPATASKSIGLDLNRFQSTAAPASPPVARQTPDGRIALFDPNTKQFLRYQ